MSPTRLLILGIDGASPDLLLRWVLDGTLPNIARVLERGRRGTLRGLDGFFIGSTWPSIYTGASPASHGLHYLVQLEPGTYQYYRPSERGLYSGDPFWRVIGRAGYRVAVLDAPLSAPESSLNGVQVLEWGSHDAVYGFRSYPDSLGEELLSRYGAHPIGSSCDAARRTAEDYGRFVDGLVTGVERRREMTLDVLNRGGWDLLMQVFSEAHCGGHQCWHLHDPTHPAHDPRVAHDVGDPLQRVYQAIDRAIGHILESAGDCRVCLFASHGMAHWYGLHALLPEILFKLGVSRPAEAAAPVVPQESPVLAAAAWVWHRLPGSVRGRLAGLRARFGPQDPVGDSLPAVGVDPQKSACFHQLHGLAIAGIRLNVAGREPDGVLQPGAEVEQFCTSLTADLLEIRDERTGNAFIKAVRRVDELYSGPRLRDLPDLVVEFNDATPTGSTLVGDGCGATVRISSPKTGVLEASNHYGRTGEHRRDGFLVFAGPGVAAGELARTPSVMDLAPTWAAMFGLTLPGADGAAIEEVGTLES